MFIRDIQVTVKDTKSLSDHSITGLTQVLIPKGNVLLALLPGSYTTLAITT
jgi:hypothetical protein